MTVFLSHTMSSVAHTARSSSAECLLVSLHTLADFFAWTFCRLVVHKIFAKIEKSQPSDTWSQLCRDPGAH